MKNLLLPLFILLFLCSQPVRAQNPDTLRAIYSAYVGVRELTHHNDGPEVERFLAHVGLKKGAPWCAAFVSYCLHKAGYTDAPRSGWSPDYFPKERRVCISRYDVRCTKYEVESDESRVTSEHTAIRNSSFVIRNSEREALLPRIGDLFGIWYTNLGRIAHVGFIDVPNGTSRKYEVGSREVGSNNSSNLKLPTSNLSEAPTSNLNILVTVEGNTNDNGSREGIGVFRKYRPLKSIKYIARWTTPRSA